MQKTTKKYVYQTPHLLLDRPSFLVKNRGMTYPWEKTLFHAMAEGLTTHKACSVYDGLPTPTEIFTTLKNDPAFKARYEEALQMMAYVLLDQIPTIADETDRDFVVRNGIRTVNNEAIQRSKLRVQARERMIEMTHPKRFKDKEAPTNNTLVIAGMDENQISEKLREILANVNRRLAEQKENQNIIDVTPTEYPTKPTETPHGDVLTVTPDQPRRRQQEANVEPPATAVATMSQQRGRMSLVYERDPSDELHAALT